jgi:VIT1/CCC1 family predicted Fe2+/Mn2+ transporter
MTSTPAYNPQLARTLVLDELFDLSLYKSLREVFPRDAEMQRTLDELIAVEAHHLAFWQKFFNLPLDRLDPGRRFKLRFITSLCRLFGATAVHLVLEAIEVYGVRKYLSLWRSYQGQPLGAALQNILQDEFKHEDALVTKLTERKINAEKIRNIFLGLNDGLVEILGAVSGFFGAFGDAMTVLMAAATTAVAGAISMGAGAFGALNSEQEVRRTEAGKRLFLGEVPDQGEMTEQPLQSAMFVGVAYFLGALVPVLPVAFGAQSAWPSIVAAGVMSVSVSTTLAFLSGMNLRRRISLNLLIVMVAVSATYGIGLIAKRLWGISV